MLGLLVIVLIGLFWVLPAVCANSIGLKKGKQNSWLWGLILGWLGVIVVVSSPTRQPLILPPRTPSLPEPTKSCPVCAESVKPAATVCRWCGHQFT